MPKFLRLKIKLPWAGQKGLIHLIPLFILLLGIIAGVYLVQHPAIFKPKAYNKEQVDPLLQAQRIENLRTTFKLPDDISVDQVEQKVKEDLLKSDIEVEGSIIKAEAEVSVRGDCKYNQQTNYAFSEYEVFPALCFTDQEREKAIELVKSGAESVVDIVLPYSQGKQALSFRDDIQQVRELLKESGLANRIVVSSISGPDSYLDGYVTTLIRIKELEQDVKENPDGSGKLTDTQEQARREYVVALRNLWSKQHDLLIGLATATAISVIDRPLKVIGKVSEPITAPIIAKLGETKNAITDFLGNTWAKAAGKTAIRIALQRAKIIEPWIQDGLVLIKKGRYKEAVEYFEDENIAKNVGAEIQFYEIPLISSKTPEKEFLDWTDWAAAESHVTWGLGNDWYSYPKIEMGRIVSRIKEEEIPDYVYREIALIHAEEWIHMLQGFSQKPLLGYKDYEVDVGAYLYNSGVELTQKFLSRYQGRSSVIE